METQTCIQKRRTIRKFLDKEIEKDKLGAILDAGRYAPSAGNLQNWRFIVVKSPSGKEKVADACVQQVWMTEAPIIIVIVSDLAQAEEFYGERGSEVYCRQNAAAAAQNILLSVCDLGLAGAWVSAFDEDMMKRALELPGNARAEVVIPIGYAGEEVPIPPRYKGVSVVNWENWGSKEDKMSGATIEKQVKKGERAAAKGIEKLKKLITQ